MLRLRRAGLGASRRWKPHSPAFFLADSCPGRQAAPNRTCQSDGNSPEIPRGDQLHRLPQNPGVSPALSNPSLGLEREPAVPQGTEQGVAPVNSGKREHRAVPGQHPAPGSSEQTQKTLSDTEVLHRKQNPSELLEKHNNLPLCWSGLHVWPP